MDNQAYLIKQVVLDYFSAYSAHQVDKILSFYVEDIEIYDGAFDSTCRGKQEVKAEVVETFLRLVPDLNWQQQANTPVTIEGDTISIEWVFSGTPAASLSDVPEEARVPFQCKGMSRFKVDSENRLIVSHADYYNPPAFFAYL